MRSTPWKIKIQPVIVTIRLKFKDQILCVNTVYKPKSKLRQPDRSIIGAEMIIWFKMYENFFLFVRAKIAIIETKRPSNLDKKMA